MAQSTIKRPGRLRFDRLGLDSASIRKSVAKRLIYNVGKDGFTATERDWLHAAVHATRDRLIERWMETMRRYYQQDVKRVYYLSLEFLMGRALKNALMNIGCLEEFEHALAQLGIDFEQLIEMEEDAALGNGGLGRLAACFLDSFATLSLPGYGYGIRYEYGIFRQSIENGQQVEHPDNWLRYGNPWEFARPEVLYPVQFGGRVVAYHDARGRLCHDWQDTTDVMAMAYDTPIPGYASNTVNNMRLWAARASRDFDLEYFNRGDYIQAVAEKTASENLAKVLYPADNTNAGRELRLKQQYFFVCASLQDILRRFQKYHDDFDQLPDKVAIQLNDTHPAIAIAELMRILLDQHGLSWERAWHITTRTFSYTNHTLMPEALETWPVSMFERLLPRHLGIIYEINRRFLDHVMHCHPGDVDLLRRMSLIDEGPPKRIRMAHLAIVGSHKVNGVAKLHTELLQKEVFRDFHNCFPGRIINVTNGITPRRWLNQANPKLSRLITEHIGNDWLVHLEKLEQLTEYASDPSFQQRFQAIKQANKQRLAQLIQRQLGIEVSTQSLFDVQIKRIHEYKRQLLNLLHVIARYNRIRSAMDDDIVPRTVIFSGKAAPSYTMAKLIIRLINDVADIINNDPAVGDRLKVVFLPNYNVSLAEIIIPAADLSEQISTAGTEASGTGNMKLALNGALTIGTLDGANIEIGNEVGEDNIFIFGLTAAQASELRTHYVARDYYESDPELRQCLDMIRNGFFSPAEPERYHPLVDNLLNQDHFLLLADFRDYLRCQQAVDQCYRQPKQWWHKAIINVAHMGTFSSDRSIREYARHIWQVDAATEG